jgi:hypothetical protein
MPKPRIDPIFYPGDGTMRLRIRADDGTETTIEWSCERTLALGASLIDHALAAKRDLEPDAPGPSGR